MKAPWVVLNAITQHMECTRCSEKESMDILVGKRLGFAAGIMNAFVNQHKNCKEGKTNGE